MSRITFYFFFYLHVNHGLASRFSTAVKKPHTGIYDTVYDLYHSWKINVLVVHVENFSR